MPEPATSGATRPGPRPGPTPGAGLANRFGPGPGTVLEGPIAHEALRAERRRTVSRRALVGQAGFAALSPNVGTLDDGAARRLVASDPTGALALLTAAAQATDPALARLALALATRLALGAAAPVGSRGGSGPARWAPADGREGELDLDRLADAVLEGDRLPVRVWERRSPALCLVVDRSGSMAGTGLALAAVTAAALAWRAPADHSVLLVSDHVVVVKAQGERRSPEAVVADLLRARASGSTDLALGLEAAQAQVARSPARRSRVLLLSDGRDTTGRDPVPLARDFEHLAVVEPFEHLALVEPSEGGPGARAGSRRSSPSEAAADRPSEPDRSAAWALALQSGARFVRLHRAEDVPSVVEHALRR